MTTERPVVPTLPRHTLEGLLAWGQRERQAVLDMLNLVPPEMASKYNALQDRLEKLEARLHRIRVQLAPKGG